MKNDLLYLGVIGALGYILIKNSQTPTINTETPNNSGSGNAMPLPNEIVTDLLKDCPIDFSIPYGTIGNSTKYSSINGKYYRQSMGASIRSVPTEISLIEFQNACKDLKALEALKLKEKKDEILINKAKFEVDLVANKFVQFNGTLIRGVM
jgi:hypothetical protein